MSSPTELAWLAGIFDGEGSFVMGFEKKRRLYNAMIHLGNTDKGIISESLRIMQELGCVVSMKQKSREGSLGKRPFTRMQVSSHDSVVVLLEALLPYLRSNRQEKGAAILEFVKLRQLKHKLSPTLRGYGEREVFLAEHVRSINKAT